MRQPEEASLLSREIKSLIEAARPYADIAKDAEAVARLYELCHFSKENMSPLFLPHVKALTLAYNNAKKSLVMRLDAKNE